MIGKVELAKKRKGSLGNEWTALELPKVKTSTDFVEALGVYHTPLTPFNKPYN